MAEALDTFRDHLSCAVCREIFTEPVSLSCQHMFCRECIEQSLSAGYGYCPECKAPVLDTNFQVNRLIRNLAEQLRIQGGRNRPAQEDLPRRLEVQQPSEECVVENLCSASSLLIEDISLLETLRDEQQREITVARDAFSFLKSQITSKLDHLVQQLQQIREDELEKIGAMEVAEVASMEDNLTNIQKALTDNENKQTLVVAALSSSDGVAYLCDNMPDVLGLLSPAKHNISLISNNTEQRELTNLGAFLNVEGITRQISSQYYE